ncbi:MAG: SIS domain-containing protein, partial [Chloroflexi bacterium]|nr:SIS domain-containing protein [Chloroflexota bacterium]
MIEVSKTHLYREIHQQPETLERFLAQERASVRRLAEAIQQRAIRHVMIAARGTSDNAGRYAKYVLGAMNGLVVSLAAPSLFTIYQRPPRLADTLVLGISQSGRSPDIVAVLAEARRQGALTAVMTNEPDSDLAQQGDVVVDLRAGEEKAVAATKTYTAELAAIALLSATLAGDGQMLASLEAMPAAVGRILAMNDAIAQVAPRYRYMERCVVIGRGYNYATAFELALKLKELTYVVAEPYSSADFLHGPLAMIEPGFPAVVIAPAGLLQAELRAFMETLHRYQAEIIAISDEPEMLALARTPLAMPPGVPEWLSPL